MDCPQCQSGNVPGGKFCSECGARLPLACPSCGAPISAEAKFCSQCGAAVGGSISTAAALPSPRPPMPAALAGGRYAIRSFLGEGARKRVYLAKDERLDREVAVALIKTDGLDETGLTRVRREAQAMGRLGSHPNIVTIHDIGDEDGQPFVVQELMDGGSLSDLVHSAPDHRLDVAIALRIGREIALALGYAHAQGIIHRDVKPGNVWLTKDRRAKLGDFGLAFAGDRTRLTQTGTMVGTMAYLPPEQALGGEVTPRSDFYSFGATLYEMLTGRPPFPGEDTVSVISQHLNTPPLPPSLLAAGVPQRLDTLVLRLLAKSPDERPATAEEIVSALDGVREGPPPSTEPTTAERARRARGPVRSPFVAREKEIGQLKDRMEDAIAGQGFLMMLVGEPGIGKTRLSEELGVHARLRGAEVLVGQCYESEGAPPYVPFVEALRQYVAGRSNEDLRQEMGDAASELAKLVSEIRTRVPEAAEVSVEDPEAERYRLLEAVTSFLVNVSRAKPLLLVLEDLHWADRPSLLLLHHLARRLADSRILVLGTYRDVELDRRHPLSDVISQLRRERLYERVLLRGFDVDGVRAFIRARAELTTNTAQEVPAQFAQTIYEQTEGNPFFMEETILHLVDTGAIYLQEGQWMGDTEAIADNIPEGVREVIGRRLSRLSETANQVLTIGSVLGREFDLDLLLALADADENAVVAALDEALGAQLISEHRGSGGPAYRFSHALVQETLYSELSLARRQRAHVRAAEAIEKLRASRIDSLIGQLAHHCYYGNERDRAISYSRRAGEAAARVYAWEEAVRHWENALDLMEDTTATEAERAALLQDLGDLTYVTGLDFEKGLQFLEQALAIYERLGERGKVAAMHSRLGRNLVSFGHQLDLPRGTPHLEAARRILEEDAPGSAALAYVYLGLCTLHFWTLAYDELRDYADKAHAIGEKLQSRPVIASALVFRGEGLAFLGHLGEAEQLMQQGLEIAEKDDLAFVAFLCMAFFSGIQGVVRRDPRTAAELCERELRKPRQSSDSSMAMTTFGFLVSLRVLLGEMERLEAPDATMGGMGPAIRDYNVATGRWDEAGRNARDIHEMGKATGNMFFVYQACLILGQLAYRCGDYAGAIRWEKEAVDIEERLNVPAFGGFQQHVWLAQALAKSGSLGEAARQLEACRGFLDNGEDWGATPGIVARAEGVLHAARNEPAEAEKCFAEAVSVARQFGIPWDEADALHERALMHLERGDRDGRRVALELLDQVIAIYRRLAAKKHLEIAVSDKVRAQGLDSIDFQTSIDAVAADVQREKPDLRQHAAPDGTVTIMFSDMEGFTAMTERLGDLQAREIVRDHNRIVREQLAAHGGYEVELQGDGFLLAFGSARRALQCAIAIQRAFTAYNEQHAEEPIRVRIGLHTGEALRDANKFFGKTVILAARIAAQAKGGEILVSSLLKELTATAGDIRFGDSRVATLKGISEPQTIFRVAWQ